MYFKHFFLVFLYLLYHKTEHSHTFRSVFIGFYVNTRLSLHTEIIFLEPYQAYSLRVEKKL